MSDENTHKTQDDSSDGYFGTCPVCHKTDGYVNVGCAHWQICRTHKLKWFIGENLFSSHQEETEAEQRAQLDRIGFHDFKAVEPYYPASVEAKHEEYLRQEIVRVSLPRHVRRLSLTNMPVTVAEWKLLGFPGWLFITRNSVDQQLRVWIDSEDGTRGTEVTEMAIGQKALKSWREVGCPTLNRQVAPQTWHFDIKDIDQHYHEFL